MMPVTIRPVEERDIPAMAAIRASYSQTHSYWMTRITGYLSGEHSPQQALLERAAFVAVEGEAVTGFVAGHRTHRFDCDAELEWIDVAQSHRRQGIAGQLILQIAAWFVQQNTLRVCVNVTPENVAGRSLYARYGAQPLGEYWMVWQDVRIIFANENIRQERIVGR